MGKFRRTVTKIAAIYIYLSTETKIKFASGPLRFCILFFYRLIPLTHFRFRSFRNSSSAFYSIIILRGRYKIGQNQSSMLVRQPSNKGKTRIKIRIKFNCILFQRRIIELYLTGKCFVRASTGGHADLRKTWSATFRSDFEIKSRRPIYRRMFMLEWNACKDATFQISP